MNLSCDDSDEAALRSAVGVGTEDWINMELPKFQQPPKPQGAAGLGALERLALRPDDVPQNVFLVTQNLVVAYDLFPKAKVHLLILPRIPIVGDLLQSNSVPGSG